MNFTLLLVLLYGAGVVGLISSVTNLKHAKTDASPEPSARAYWHKFSIVAFLGTCGLALLGATRTTEIAAPHTTGIGSWMVCYMVCLFAAEALFRATRNGMKLRAMARYRGVPSPALHPMLRGR